MENNKLIAEFMGFQYDRRDLITDKQLLSIEDCKYHSSWDWLMPVVEIIEKTNRINDKEYYPYMVTIWKNCCTITDGNNGAEIVIIYDTDKLTATYSAIVTFIKWYNGKKE